MDMYLKEKLDSKPIGLYRRRSYKPIGLISIFYATVIVFICSKS